MPRLSPSSPLEAQEISDRKLAEEETRQLADRLATTLDTVNSSLQSLRELADAMPQIVWSATPDGRVDYFNQRWLDYTGMTGEEAQARQWLPVLHPDDLADTVAGWTLAVKEGREYEAAFRFRRASDVEYRWHLARAMPVRDAGGTIAKWYGTCTDIQDQKTATEDAQRANRAKSEFLADMSHEIRTR